MLLGRTRPSGRCRRSEPKDKIFEPPQCEKLIKMFNETEANPAKAREQQILDCAALVFAKHGFRNTDVQEIADRLAIGKGTIYRHFGSKDSLFLAAVDRGMQQLDERLKKARATADDPFAAIKRVVYEYLAFFDENPQFVELFILERAEFRDRKKPTYAEYRDANWDEWEAATKDLMANGRFRKLPVRDIMEVMNNLLYSTIFTGVFTERDRPMAHQADLILDIVMNGLLAQKQTGANET